MDQIVIAHNLLTIKDNVCITFCTRWNQETEEEFEADHNCLIPISQQKLLL